MNNGWNVTFRLSCARGALYICETCSQALCSPVILEMTPPQSVRLKTGVCILIINEFVDKMDGYLTGPTPSSSSVYIIVNFHSFCCFDQNCYSGAHFSPPFSTCLFFCAKSVEKMKQPSDPRAVRTVACARVCVCFCLTRNNHQS